MPTKKPRASKTKQEITEEMRRKAKINREIALCKMIWPLLEVQDSIYDAQTVLNAASGYVSFETQKRMDEIKVSELKIDLSKEPESKIKDSVLSIIGLIDGESAKDSSSLLERFGKTLSQYGAAQYLKNPMKSISMKDIIS